MEQVYSYFTPPSKFAINNLFYTDGLGILYSDNFHIDRNKFRNNLFMYVQSGTIYVEQNGFFKLQEGDMIVLRLDIPHKYYTDPVDVGCAYWMHFADKNMPQLLNYIENQVGLPYRCKNEKVKEIIRQSIDVCKKNNENIELIISMNIYNILINITQSIKSEESKWDISDKDRFIKEVNTYIERNIYKKITLDELANHCNVSKYHFCKLFKRYLDCSPMNYCNKVKITRSQMALIYTSEEISKIAQDYGFSSQSHYTKLFKEITGVTPKVYRKNATF